MKRIALALAIFVGLHLVFLEPVPSAWSLGTPPVIEEPEPVTPCPWPPIAEPETAP